jgi:hypothetical protein
MEESGPKNSSLLTRRFLPDAFDFDTALVWTLERRRESDLLAPIEGEDRSGIDAISTVQTGAANVGSLAIEPIRRVLPTAGLGHEPATRSTVVNGGFGLRQQTFERVSKS